MNEKIILAVASFNCVKAEWIGGIDLYEKTWNSNLVNCVGGMDLYEKTWNTNLEVKEGQYLPARLVFN